MVPLLLIVSGDVELNPGPVGNGKSNILLQYMLMLVGI